MCFCMRNLCLPIVVCSLFVFSACGVISTAPQNDVSTSMTTQQSQDIQTSSVTTTVESTTSLVPSTSGNATATTSAAPPKSALSLVVDRPIVFVAQGDLEDKQTFTLPLEKSRTFVACLNRQVVDRVAFRSRGEYVFCIEEQFFSISFSEGWINLLDEQQQPIQKSIKLSDFDVKTLRDLLPQIR